MIVEQGRYRFMAGGSSEDIRLSVTAEVSGERLSRRGFKFSAASFDSASSIRLRYSRKFHQECVICRGWNGSVTYGGLDLTDAAAVEADALCITGIGKLNLSIGEFSAEAEIQPGNSRDDFSVCRIPLPEGLTADSLTLSINEGSSLRELRIIRR